MTVPEPLTEDARRRRSAALTVAGISGVAAIVAVVVTFLRAVNPVPFDGVIRAIDPSTGEELWKLELGMEPTPVFADDALIIVEANGIRAIDAEGHTRWHLTDGRIAAATASGSVVYADRDVGGAAEVVAVDAGTGNVLWTRPGRVRDAGAEIAVIREGHEQTLVVDAVSGDELAVFPHDGIDTLVGGGLAAVLERRSLTVVRRDGTIVELAVGPDERDRSLAAIHDPIVVTQHRDSSRERVLTGYDIATGQARWSGRFELYDRLEQYEGTLALWYPDRLSYLDVDSGRSTPDHQPSFRRTGTSAGIATIFRARRSGEPSPLITLYTTSVDRPYGSADLGPQYEATLAVAADTNRVLWTKPGSAPVASNESTTILETGSELVAIRTQNGERIAAIETGRVADVAAASRHVYVYTNGEVTAIAADRSITTPIETDSMSGIVAADDEVIVLAGATRRDGERRRFLTAFDVDTGERLWRRAVRGYRSASLDDGHLVLTKVRAVVSIDARTGERSQSRHPTGDEISKPARPEPTDVLLALRWTLDRRLWTRWELDHRATLGIIGDTPVIVSLAPRFDT